MSCVIRRGKVFHAKFRLSTGAWVMRSCGTHDRALAKAIARMTDDLGLRGRQAWYYLDAVAAGRISLSQLYDAYAQNRLEALRDSLEDTDLSPLVDEWLSSLRGRLSPDTMHHYRVHVRSLIPEGRRFPRTAFTFERLSEWLAHVDGKNATRRKYHAAMSGFAKYLRSRGILRVNPMQDVKAPSAGAPRMRYLEHDDVLRVVEALPEPYRTLEALVHGTGMEVSVALGLKRRDVDFQRGEIRARGTKTKSRDRVAIVEPWALAYVEALAKTLLPNAPLFPGLNRWTASDKHREACAALGIEDYQLRDSRHTYAVRAVRATAPFEVVAQQLGHSDTSMVVKVYGRFRPSESEARNWHRVAAAQDEARAAR